MKVSLTGIILNQVGQVQGICVYTAVKKYMIKIHKMRDAMKTSAKGSEPPAYISFESRLVASRHQRWMSTSGGLQMYLTQRIVITIHANDSHIIVYTNAYNDSYVTIHTTAARGGVG